MRHKAPGRFVRFWHRLRRNAAHFLDVGAGMKLGALVGTLTVTLALGVGAFVTFPTVTGEITAGPADAVREPAPPKTLRPETTPSPSGGSEPADPTPETSRSTPESPESTPLPSSDLTESREPDPETDSPSTPPTSPPPSTHGRTPADARPPDTVISMEQPAPDAAWFAFGANEDASFRCSLDEAPFTPCESPTFYSELKPGWHTLAVAAVDSAGNTDPSPAEARWHAHKGKPDDDD